ncbi:UNVERIFIED_CONTAM: hypothetical protein FKN15_046850 [Acipenser sinensis]
MNELNDHSSYEERFSYFDAVDESGTGYINFEEFLKLGLFLAALSAERIQLVQIELPKKVTRTTEEVTGKAKFSACLGRQL